MFSDVDSGLGRDASDGVATLLLLRVGERMGVFVVAGVATRASRSAGVDEWLIVL